jgi:hypothetical protein
MGKGDAGFRPGTPPPLAGGESATKEPALTPLSSDAPDTTLTYVGHPARTPWWFRVVLVVAGLAAWFGTQALIGARAFPQGRIGDAVLDWTAPVNAFLNENHVWANTLLIVSSAMIDAFGVFLLARSVFGPTLRPFLGLLLLLGLRQICQGLCALPQPEGMIWWDPGFPSLLVTYGVSNDLFFSGHTGVAVFGAMELSRMGWRWLVPIAVAAAVFESVAVLVLRAHYTMDVFAGAMTALLVGVLVGYLAPPCDRALARFFASFRAR